MKKFIFFIQVVAFLFNISFVFSQDAIFNIETSSKYEVRAVWLTTIGGLDWPHSYAHDGMGIANQQKELCDILDKYVEAGINTVLLQTRIRGTVIYPSELETWDGCLSGRPGHSPGYDALAFAINECHRRGLKIHAWIVSIPVGKWSGEGCSNIRKRHSGLLKKIGDEGYMNPESPETAHYLARVCNEIASRYDIDGIHLDYIRYPENWGKIADRQKARDNISDIVCEVSETVKKIKPWIIMSCSPVGKYADTKRARSRGWNARDAVCQDVELWLKKGWMDMIFPMMYFKDDNFYPFVVDWKERSHHRMVVPGLGIYFMHTKEKNWPLVDITREMQFCRSMQMGTCFFRSKFFTDNVKGIYDYTSAIYSTSVSLVPPVSSIGHSMPPSQPSNVSMSVNSDIIKLSWGAPNGSDTFSDKAVSYNIYGSDCLNVNVEDGSNLLAAGLHTTTLTLPPFGKVRYFAVTAVDRYGNESLPAYFLKDADGVANTELPEMLCCDERFLYLDSSDLPVESVIEFHSVTGSIHSASLVRNEGGRFIVDISSLSCGHYKAYWLSRKGYRHLLGRFLKWTVR